MYISKLERVLQKIFGSEAEDTQMVEFGSPTNGRAVYSKDPSKIQSDYYEAGWFPESLSGNIRPYAEDMNGLHFVHSYQLAYLLQAGIPEWDKDTPYFKDCIVRVGRILYVAKDKGSTINKGNVPGSPTGNQWWDLFTIGEQGVPVGASLEWNSDTLPAGGKWLFENGQGLRQSEYPELYDVIKDTFGGYNQTENGQTVHYFRLPDSRARVAVGKSSDNPKLLLGNVGGQFNHEHFIPAHYHGKGSLAIGTSGVHAHQLNDNGHDHALPNHQHLFRFGDYSAAKGTNVKRLANLGSSGSGSNTNPTKTSWNSGPDGGNTGHYYKMTSGNVPAGGDISQVGVQLYTTASGSNINCISATHSHPNNTITGHVGSVGHANGDNGTMKTVTVNTNNNSSNMPYVVKRKIMRVKP